MLVVVLDFLVPATVLGMVGPVVAKMAVEQARKAGSAIGDVYFWGAMGSIAGTFLCGFVLMYLAPTSTIVILVAGGARALGRRPDRQARRARRRNRRCALALGLGSITPLVSWLEPGGRRPGLLPVELPRPGRQRGGGRAGSRGFDRAAPRPPGRRRTGGRHRESMVTEPRTDAPRPSLTDLAILAFVASLAFMALEMVAGRLVQRHLGSSIYGWTSVIGVLLAGLSFGNFLGGKIADFVKNEKQASWLFLAASVLTLGILLLETQPKWFAEMFLGGESKSFLSQAITLSKLELGRSEHPDVAGPTGSCSSSRSSSFCPRSRWGRSAPWSPSWRSTG